MTRASKPLRFLTLTAPVVLLAGLALAPPDARAADKEVIKARLVACPSDKTVIGGVNACGKIWKLRSGDAELYQSGKVEVDLDGLVLNDPSVGNANGTPDGVDAVAIALVCGGSTAASVAAQTDPVKLSPKGDAKIKANLTMPAGCVAPVILVRERYEGNIGGWLAATGF